MTWAYQPLLEAGLTAGASWLENVNTQRTVDVSAGNVQLRLRIGIKNTGGVTGPTAFEYAYSKNSGAYAALTNASSNVKTFDTIWYADTDDVPQLLTSGNYQEDNNAAEDSTGAFTLAAGLAAAYSAETEIALEVIAADVANTDTIDIRVRQADDTVFDTYTVTARIVISKAAGPVTHNTRSFPLGIEIGMGWRMAA